MVQDISIYNMKPENPQPKPPKWLDKLLEWFCASHLLEEIQGDLHERYLLRLKKSGARKANRQYLKEVLVYFRPSFIKRKSQPTPYFIMFRHNLLLIYRNFLRYKSTFFINLIGLSTGLACALLIYLWVKDELSVDKFHEKDNRLYQVMENKQQANGIWTSRPEGGPVP
jgi:putative ABC transport system permease protein